MKVKALSDHACYCCGRIIKKGEDCIVFLVNPENPAMAEFDVIYTCTRCSREESCQVKVRRRGAEQ